jgi:hypothetical protein
MARRIIGITFIVAAIVGLLFSIAGVALVWVVKDPLTTNLLTTLDLISTTLEATSSGLTIADETISKAISDVTTIENTIQTASRAIGDSVPIIESLASLMSESLPDAIEATQTGLASVEDAARTIESTLRLVTSIPLLPLESYDPDVSLVNALGDVSSSLDPIPDSMIEMENSLNTTKGNMTMIAAQANIISRSIGDLKTSLYELQLVLDQYLNVFSTLQERIDSIYNNLPTIVNVSAWITTFIFIWLGIAQLGLLTQGLERFNWPLSKKLSEDEIPDFTKEESEKDDYLQDVETPPDSGEGDPNQ